MIFLWLLLAAVGLTAAGIIIAANQSAYTEGAGLNAPQEIAATWEG